MEYKNHSFDRLMTMIKIITSKNILRLFVLLSVVLALVAGLGWEKLAVLEKKYKILEKKHERLNRIYLQEKGQK